MFSMFLELDVRTWPGSGTLKLKFEPRVRELSKLIRTHRVRRHVRTQGSETFEQLLFRNLKGFVKDLKRNPTTNLVALKTLTGCKKLLAFVAEQ